MPESEPRALYMVDESRPWGCTALTKLDFQVGCGDVRLKAQHPEGRGRIHTKFKVSLAFIVRTRLKKSQ